MTEYRRMQIFSGNERVDVSRRLHYEIEPYGEHAFGHLRDYPKDIEKILDGIKILPINEELITVSDRNNIKNKILEREVKEYTALVNAGRLTLNGLFNKVESLGWDAVVIADKGRGQICTKITPSQAKYGLVGDIRLSCNKALAEVIGQRRKFSPYWIGDARTVE